MAESETTVDNADPNSLLGRGDDPAESEGQEPATGQAPDEEGFFENPATTEGPDENLVP